MMIVVLTVVFAAIVYFQVPSLVKQKMWGELGAFSFFMLLAIFYAYGQFLHFPLPNPTRLLERIFGPLAEWINRALGVS